MLSFIASLLLAGQLCGLEARYALWQAATADPALQPNLAVSLENFRSFDTVEGRDAFYAIAKDVLDTGGDIGAHTIARALGKVGVSVGAVEEYLRALHYYRRPDGTLIPGLIKQANEGATRNMVRVAGYGTPGPALAEMLEPIAMKRLGIAPDAIDGFGKKIDVSQFGVGASTIEADCLLKDGTFYDSKWTNAAEIDPLVISDEQLTILTKLFGNTDPALTVPIREAVFVTNKPLSVDVLTAIDNANSNIRIALGLPPGDASVFIRFEVVGDLT